MERRYLVATLALVATFAIFSREFRSGHLANLPCPRTQLMSELRCARDYVKAQLLAKARPFVNRGVPEEQQMIAELNLPVLAAANEEITEVQAQIAQQTAEKQCDAAMRAQDRALRAQERTLRSVERAQERAAEISSTAQERSMAINERTALRAQEISTRAIERAQRVMEKSQWKMDKFQLKMIQPNAPLAPNAPVAPMPIDFRVDLPADFDQQVHAAVESRLAVKCVRTKVAAQQYQTVMIQRVNQNMANNVHVVVSAQDVSGLTALTQCPKSQTALRQIEHDVQRFQDHLVRSVDRAFATL